MEVMEDREVWRLNLEQLLPQPLRKAGNEERKEEDGLRVHDYMLRSSNTSLLPRFS